MFGIGMIVYGGINSFHSVEYNVAESKYAAEIEAIKIASNKAKAEAKAEVISSKFKWHLEFSFNL